jgi:hypothetical protein
VPVLRAYHIKIQNILSGVWEIAEDSLGRQRLFATFLAKSSDQQRVSIGAVKAKNVDSGFAFGRINYLPNPQ